MEYAIIIGIVLIIVVGIIFGVISNNKIKKNGVEAEAEIIRINTETTQIVNDETGIVDTDTIKHYFIKFKTQTGEEIETELNNPGFGAKEGDIIKIKYLPENPNRVIRIKE